MGGGQPDDQCYHMNVLNTYSASTCTDNYGFICVVNATLAPSTTTTTTTTLTFTAPPFNETTTTTTTTTITTSAPFPAGWTLAPLNTTCQVACGNNTYNVNITNYVNNNESMVSVATHLAIQCTNIASAPVVSFYNGICHYTNYVYSNETYIPGQRICCCNETCDINGNDIITSTTIPTTIPTTTTTTRFQPAVNGWHLGDHGGENCTSVCGSNTYNRFGTHSLTNINDTIFVMGSLGHNCSSFITGVVPGYYESFVTVEEFDDNTNTSSYVTTFNNSGICFHTHEDAVNDSALFSYQRICCCNTTCPLLDGITPTDQPTPIQSTTFSDFVFTPTGLYVGVNGWYAASSGDSCTQSCSARGGTCNQDGTRSLKTVNQMNYVFRSIYGIDCYTTDIVSGAGGSITPYVTLQPFGCVFSATNDFNCNAFNNNSNYVRLCCCASSCLIAPPEATTPPAPAPANQEVVTTTVAAAPTIKATVITPSESKKLTWMAITGIVGGAAFAVSTIAVLGYFAYKSKLIAFWYTYRVI